jgi:tripartite-type tricarboxylate transporter receptor subunit TctC
MSSRRRFVVSGFAAAALVSLGRVAMAQDRYPSKSIKMIVPHPPGGGVDIIARNLAAALQPTLGQAFVVENHPGANGMIGAQIAAKAPADGYTLVMDGPGEIVIAPHLFKSMTYDPAKDLQPITLCSNAPNVLVVGPSTSAKSVAELIALAKAEPGKLTFGSSGVGNIQHLNGELFNKLAGVRMTHVPYKGAAPQMAGIVGGQIDMGYVSVAAALPMIQSNRLRPLAVTSRQRVPQLPDVPALAETPSLATYELNNWFGLFAPAGVPAGRLVRIHEAVTAVLGSPKVKQFIIDGGAVPAPMSIVQFTEFLAGQSQTFARIVREANITADS